MIKLLSASVSVLLISILSPAAIAQSSAVPPIIRIIVPFAPGASTDIVARKAATQLSSRLGNSVIVENRSGGSTMIGAGAVANGPRDGSLLLLTTPSTVSAAATMRNVPFDMNNDLIPIAMISDGPMTVAASAQSGIRSPADLVAMARANPDSVTYGTSGIGSLPHLSSEHFADAAKIRLKHIPYKGGALAVVDLAAGTIDVMLGTYLAFAPQIKAGRVHAIAVTTPQPSAALPGLPTMASVAPGYSGSVWLAVFAQANTPSSLSERLNREFNEISLTKDISETLAADGAVPVTMRLPELRARMRENFNTWKRLAVEKKIEVE